MSLKNTWVVLVSNFFTFVASYYFSWPTMRNLSRFCCLMICLGTFSPIWAQVGYRLDYNLKQAIVQNKDYPNPNFDASTQTKPTHLGPAFGSTYIAEPQAKTLQQLAQLYPLQKAVQADDWPVKYALKTARYVFVRFNNGVMMPAIRTANGALFSFLVEEGFLTLDIKHLYNKDGQQRIGWMTTEVLKKKD
ncbi:MAG TPA: hypothetical protein DCS93_04530 [Microscillaceae bacterium]|nr:hypothetical protein [Microscillaceae bacterium]